MIPQTSHIQVTNGHTLSSNRVDTAICLRFVFYLVFNHFWLIVWAIVVRSETCQYEIWRLFWEIWKSLGFIEEKCIVDMINTIKLIEQILTVKPDKLRILKTFEETYA